MKSKEGFHSQVDKGSALFLGYYSSWPLFALTHHMLVWWAAWRVRPGVRFWDYALGLLGDDIVIADPEVAESYKQVMAEAEVTISIEKSLVSDKGALEFAKRFLTEGGTVDLSPVSCRMLRTLVSSISAYQFQD
jgi:hypothetical protein